MDWSPFPDFLFLIVLSFFTEISLRCKLIPQSSVILRVVVVLLVLELFLLGLTLESFADRLNSESGFSLKDLKKLVWLFHLLLLGCSAA